MKMAFVLYKKELRSLLDSTIPYAAVVFFLLFTSVWFFFVQRFFLMDYASLREYFSSFPLAFLVMVPSLTMRSWSEELKSGTAEILYSLPLTEFEIVLGKFAAAYSLVVAAILLTIPVPLSLNPLGYFDPGPILGEYAGALLLGAAATSVGVFMSSAAKSQAAAFVGTLSLLLFVSVCGRVAGLIAVPPAAADVLNSMSLNFHYDRFARGVIDSRDVAYFLLSVAFFLFLSNRAILSGKWK